MPERLPTTLKSHTPFKKFNKNPYKYFEILKSEVLLMSMLHLFSFICKLWSFFTWCIVMPLFFYTKRITGVQQSFKQRDKMAFGLTNVRWKARGGWSRVIKTHVIYRTNSTFPTFACTCAAYVVRDTDTL